MKNENKVEDVLLKLATKNKAVADLLIDYNSENKSVIEEATNEYVHDVQLNQKEMSLIEWGLNSLFSFNISAEEREQVEQLLEKLNDC